MRRGSCSSVRIFYPSFDRQKVVEALSAKLPELARKLPLVRVVLFGSYAKGNYTVASDVDLLVVYSGQRREDAFATVKKALRVPRLEPHVYTESEYEAMRQSLDRMAEGGVVLFPRGGMASGPLP